MSQTETVDVFHTYLTVSQNTLLLKVFTHLPSHAYEPE